MQEDFGEMILPNVLGRFSRAHSKVRIQASVARHLELMKQFTSNQLDLALVWGVEAMQLQNGPAGSPLTGELLAQPDMCWIGSSSQPLQLAENEPLPLVTFNGPCQFLETATAALDRAGIPWRVSFTSPSLAGLWAAASAGLGVTVRTRYGLPSTVAVIDPLSAPTGCRHYRNYPPCRWCCCGLPHNHRRRSPCWQRS
jgi:DNA-binding transcriptional LysR family regulator